MSVLACDRCVSLGDAYTCRRCRMSLSLLPASYLTRRVGVRRACDGDGQAGGTQRFSPPSPSAGNLVAREARMSTSEHEHGGMWCDRPEFVCVSVLVSAPRFLHGILPVQWVGLWMRGQRCLIMNASVLVRVHALIDATSRSRAAEGALRFDNWAGA
jgi:hypothetical protein